LFAIVSRAGSAPSTAAKPAAAGENKIKVPPSFEGGTALTKARNKNFLLFSLAKYAIIIIVQAVEERLATSFLGRRW